MIKPLRFMRKRFIITIALTLLSVSAAQAGDWPQWRYGVGHGASTADGLPEDLQLQWVRQLPQPRKAWPMSQHKLQFDLSYEPVVMGKLIIVPSMLSDRVTAYDTESGQERWRFYAGGPVRFAPAGWQGKLYVVSDDGYLYCLDAKTGKSLWQFRGGPSAYRVLGNERLISMWPARGAPVVSEGTVYFTAGIWPFMGTFVHALDASSGKVIWTNSGSASDFILQPHSSPAFAGVAPQGYLSISGDKLLVAGGRSVPAIYDRRTGDLLYYHANTKNGGYSVSVNKGYFFNDGQMCQVSDGKSMRRSAATVFDAEAIYGADSGGFIRAESPDLTFREVVDKKGKKKREAQSKTLWERQTRPRVAQIFIKAGRRLYGGNASGLIAAIDLPGKEADGRRRGQVPPAADISWSMQLQGAPWTMLAADDKLFVVTTQGSLYCFGAKASAHVHLLPAPAKHQNDRRWRERARKILNETESREGYALVLGLGTGQLLEEIVRQSNLRVIGLDSDAKKVEALRRRFDQASLYGDRVTLIQGTILDTPISPYLASLVVTEDPNAAGYSKDSAEAFITRLFHVLRPYGGAACLTLEGERQVAFRQSALAANLPGSKIEDEGDLTVLRRVGSLPDSAPWTHHYADASNSIFSPDKRVKAPLGLLWFGGSSHLDVLPRHGHGPAQQVMGGRLFVQGIEVLSARDVYTGRVLWRRELPKLDTFDMYYDKSFKLDIYDRSYNQLHIPGANAWGSNFVTARDRLYLIMGETCLVLDPATGDTLHEWTLAEKDDIGIPKWGYVSVYKDLLIAGIVPFHIDKDKKQWTLQFNHRFATGSRYLTVLDRYTGKVLWERKAAYNFRHNTIIAGRDKVYCIDSLSPDKKKFMTGRGLSFGSKPRVLALDARTGQELWTADDKVFGTWLGYSQEHDLVLQAGASAGDRASDEVGKGMAAYRGADGERLWYSDESYDGPPILYHGRIMTQTGGSNTVSSPSKTFDLLTGERVTTPHPLTGEAIPQEWVRFKGCNTAIASEHLLTFRSASAAYVDLTCSQGTTTIGGFRPGCTSNLLAADGVLNAPDYTRTCTCSYQNQTSLALVHFPPNDPWYPGVETWSFDYLAAPKIAKPVKRVGINFGAAGNRNSSDGTLWLEYPSVGGPSPDIPIHVQGAEPTLFRHHVSRVAHGKTQATAAPTWVVASGLEGVETITIRPFVQPANPELDKKGRVQAFQQNAHDPAIDELWPDAVGSFGTPIPYTVTLYFSNVEGLAAGKRVFDVALQGQTLLKDFDIAAEMDAGEGYLVKAFKQILITDTLEIALTNKPGHSAPTLICGIELLAEEGEALVVGSQ